MPPLAIRTVLAAISLAAIGVPEATLAQDRAAGAGLSRAVPMPEPLPESWPVPGFVDAPFDAPRAPRAWPVPGSVAPEFGGAQFGVAPFGGAPLGLAARLAAAQIYLGITAQQQDAWRNYCQQLIGFAEPDAPPPAARGSADAGQPLPSEQMALIALARAEKARSLLNAASDLRAVLDPLQLARLHRAEAGFGPAEGRPPNPDARPDPGARPVTDPRLGVCVMPARSTMAMTPACGTAIDLPRPAPAP